MVKKKVKVTILYRKCSIFPEWSIDLIFPYEGKSTKDRVDFFIENEAQSGLVKLTGLEYKTVNRILLI